MSIVEMAGSVALLSVVFVVGRGSGEEKGGDLKAQAPKPSFDDRILQAVREGRFEPLRPMMMTAEEVLNARRHGSRPDREYTLEQAREDVRKLERDFQEKIEYIRNLLHASGVKEVESISLESVLVAPMRMDEEWLPAKGPPCLDSGDAVFRIYRLESQGRLNNLVCRLSRITGRCCVGELFLTMLSAEDVGKLRSWSAGEDPKADRDVVGLLFKKEVTEPEMRVLKGEPESIKDRTWEMDNLNRPRLLIEFDDLGRVCAVTIGDRVYKRGQPMPAEGVTPK